MAVAAMLLCLVAITGVAAPAHADACVKGGVYVLFARGSGEYFDDNHANRLHERLIGDSNKPGVLIQLGIPAAWAELGNLDNNGKVSAKEYPAAGGDNPFSTLYGWAVNPRYSPSVIRGRDELLQHLYERVVRCEFAGARETIVLAGYSQGADVIGWTLGLLKPQIKRHIAYVALYGDPKFDAGNGAERRKGIKPWWVQGDAVGWRTEYVLNGAQKPACPRGQRAGRLCWPTGQLRRGRAVEVTIADSGVLGARQPYAPADMQGRFGSWCDHGDGICTGRAVSGVWGVGSHNWAYDNDKQPDNGWIAKSASVIAAATIAKISQLNPDMGPLVPVQPTRTALSAPTNKPLG